jgi:hypothetical protein
MFGILSIYEKYDQIYDGLLRTSFIDDQKAEELAILCLAKFLNLTKNEVKDQLKNYN